jgi:hypothetical protein
MHTVSAWIAAHPELAAVLLAVLWLNVLNAVVPVGWKRLPGLGWFFALVDRVSATVMHGAQNGAPLSWPLIGRSIMRELIAPTPPPPPSQPILPPPVEGSQR